MNELKPRMRTLDAAFDYVKQGDPETSLTKYALRQAVITGKLPSVKAGKKYLVNLDILEKWLEGGNTASEMPETVNGIRRIEVKPVLREVSLS